MLFNWAEKEIQEDLPKFHLEKKCFLTIRLIGSNWSKLNIGVTTEIVQKAYLDRKAMPLLLVSVSIFPIIRVAALFQFNLHKF